MPLLETFTLEHVPAQYSVHAALFRDVSNAGFLQSQLLARNADFEYAFIDASTIVSRFHVLAAVYKALSVLIDSTLRTPNVHAETVIALSSSNNVIFAHPVPAATCPPKPPNILAHLLTIRYYSLPDLGSLPSLRNCCRSQGHHRRQSPFPHRGAPPAAYSG